MHLETFASATLTSFLIAALRKNKTENFSAYNRSLKLFIQYLMQAQQRNG